MTARQAFESVVGPPPDVSDMTLLCSLMDALKKHWRDETDNRDKIRKQLVTLAEEGLRLYGHVG